MTDEHFKHAIQNLPDLAETIAKIRDVRREAFGRPYEEFFEPKSAFDSSGKSPRLIGVTLPDVQAWAKHIAYSTRVRMLALEPTIFDMAATDHVTPAMALLRSHAETAGLACLALMTLRDGDANQLRDTIQRTLFGGALARGWKSPDSSSFVPLTESEPPTAGQLMGALDRFIANGGEGNGRYRAIYGLLCEFAHPNSRGRLGFMRSTEQPPVGWRIRYSATEEVSRTDVGMVMQILLEMMRLGYSASELLRLGTIEVAGDGFVITPPEARALKRVLTKLMLLEVERQKTDLVH